MSLDWTLLYPYINTTAFCNLTNTKSLAIFFFHAPKPVRRAHQLLMEIRQLPSLEIKS